MGQVWGTDSLGGYMYSDELSDTLRCALQPMVRFRQHCDAKDAINKGKKKGDTYNWNVYSDVQDQGGEIGEEDAMPESNFVVTQGSLTVTEFGNSVPFTSKLDDLSKHDVEEVIDKVLKNDAAKAFDISARKQFESTPLVGAATSATAITFETDGACSNNNASALLKAHIKLIVDYMKERNIPTFSDGDYFSIARPSTYRAMKNELEDVHKYVETGYRKIMNGEIGRYEGVRFIEQTNIAAQTNFATNGVSDEAYFFGQDTVAEAIACPEEIRGKIPTDYGRSKGIAWYYLGGFGIFHGVAADARIFKWDSAA
jgi:N4-gp56 family major capsid protein